jgi:hypothetical protein
MSFIDSLQAIGSEELARRWQRAERRIRENGVTYNIYTDTQGASRPLAIDPIPLLIAPEEWRLIEAGIIQRAHLLNLILEDIYGARRLVANGDLPAELLFANPSFLRPLTGVAVPKNSYLHLLAVDLARSPDGRWWVLADRTQSPSGTGYALENRTIVSDVLPDTFHEANVRRLASFFRAQRETLLGLANDVGLLAYPSQYHTPKLPGMGDVDWGKFFSVLTDVGYHGPVTIYSTGLTTAAGQKQIAMTPEGLLDYYARASCATNTNIYNIQARHGFIEKMAWKRAGQQKSQAESIASQHAASRVAGQMNSEAGKLIAEQDRSCRLTDHASIGLWRVGQARRHELLVQRDGGLDAGDAVLGQRPPQPQDG